MFDSFWIFLSDPGNRATLGWIGGGVVTIVVGAWAAFKFFAGREAGSGSKPSVRAKIGSVAIGRDATNSSISVDARKPPKR